MLEGACHFAVAGHEPITVETGDFILAPAAYDYTVSSLEPPGSVGCYTPPVELAVGQIRLGDADRPADTVMLVGHCTFGSQDAALLISLLPELVHVRGEARLATLVQLVGEESRGRRPAREVVLARLLEVLLIEALRTTTEVTASPGLVRGMADPRLAIAIRRMHERPAHPWTVGDMAREAAMSRSTFFERFRRAVGVAPMAYLLTWRMALAKTRLRSGGGISDVAAHVGYSSASTFSVAFQRHVGKPPTRYRPRGSGHEGKSGGHGVDGPGTEGGRDSNPIK